MHDILVQLLKSWMFIRDENGFCIFDTYVYQLFVKISLIYITDEKASKLHSYESVTLLHTLTCQTWLLMRPLDLLDTYDKLRL